MSTDPNTLTELIIVCGHATFVGSHKDIMSEERWILQPFQRSNPSTGKRGEHETFMQHVLAATFVAASRPESFIIFTGGNTTNTNRTEAQGYEQVHLGLDDPWGIGDRYAREDYATDSFQNLLFSILRFRQVVGRYPRDITVVTHTFKRKRILALHAAALRWPDEHIRLQGIDPPFTKAEWDETRAGESRAKSEFARHPYGNYPPLSDKRMKRNFNADAVEKSFAGLEPEALQLLRFSNRGEEGLELPDRFPWESRGEIKK